VTEHFIYWAWSRLLLFHWFGSFDRKIHLIESTFDRKGYLIEKISIEDLMMYLMQNKTQTSLVVIISSIPPGAMVMKFFFPWCLAVSKKLLQPN
jgi:hypothetical protein